MNTLFHRARLVVVMLAVVAAAGCRPPSRFALRPPVVRENDTGWILRRPAPRQVASVTHGIDQIALRSISHALRFEHVGEAYNVNSMDEVPDSSWFTNRSLTPEEAAIGPCSDEPPRPPFTVLSGKEGGLTPGLFVRDAAGRRYALKFDQHPVDQPELSTAADVITSRLYWAIGYNTPCNRVAWVDASELVLAPGAYYTDELGRRRSLSMARIHDALRVGTRRADGRTRVSLSRFVEGEPLGPWPGEGVRKDDPNDRIPHEHRRELRGERLLAAWVDHWDSREPNTLDTFVSVPGTAGGYVRHWYIDFADSLGSEPLDVARRPYTGHAIYVDPGTVVLNVLTLGLVRRTWDDIAIDPRPPTMRFFTVERFDPAAWLPTIPVPRFDCARDQDLGWMARKIARITPDHLRAIVSTGELTNAAVESHVLRTLLGRRMKLLRWAFARTSPLADPRVIDRGDLCLVDLGVETGLSRWNGAHDGTRYAVEIRRGAALVRSMDPVRIRYGDRRAEVCFALPRHFAPANAPMDSAERYMIVDIARMDHGEHTFLRVHFYDLGSQRGYALVGIER